MSAYSNAVRASVDDIGAWAELPFFSGSALTTIVAKLESETADILPPAENVFAALKAVSPEKVKVIILGQDPYPTPGHAHGLAFSVQRGVKPLARSPWKYFQGIANGYWNRTGTWQSEQLGHARGFIA